MTPMAQELGTRLYPIFPTHRLGSLTRRARRTDASGNETITSSAVMSYKGEDSPMQYVFPLQEGVLGLKFLFWFSAPFINAAYIPNTSPSTSEALASSNPGVPIKPTTHAFHTAVNLTLHYRLLLLPFTRPPEEAYNGIHDPQTQVEPSLPVGTTRADNDVTALFYKYRGRTILGTYQASGSAPVERYYMPAHAYTHPAFGQFYIPASGSISDPNEPDALCAMRGKIALTRTLCKDNQAQGFYIYSPGVYVVETALNTAGFRAGILEFAVGSQDGLARVSAASITANNSISHYDQWTNHTATNVASKPIALFVRGIATALEI